MSIVKGMGAARPTFVEIGFCSCVNARGHGLPLTSASVQSGMEAKRSVIHPTDCLRAALPDVRLPTENSGDRCACLMRNEHVWPLMIQVQARDRAGLAPACRCRKISPGQVAKRPLSPRKMHLVTVLHSLRPPASLNPHACGRQLPELCSLQGAPRGGC